MHSAPSQPDAAISEELASHRHRPALVEMFPAGDDYAVREAAYLRSMLVDPLGELVRSSTDDRARAMAVEALASREATNDPLTDCARLEDALVRIAAATFDEAARLIAEDAVAFYRGR